MAAKWAAKVVGGVASSAGAVIGGAAENAAGVVGEAAGKVGQAVGDAAKNVQEGAALVVANAGNQAGKAKQSHADRKENFSSLESLQPVVNVVNDAAMALSDTSRTIQESAIPEVAAGAICAGIGGVGSFAALYGLGTAGLSAAGITSGLAAAGAVVGGGMVAGVFVLAAPVAIAAGAGVAVAARLKNKQLCQEKERLYKEALAKQQAIIQALKDESDASAERLEYLQALNILLERAVRDLRDDLDIQGEQ